MRVEGKTGFTIVELTVVVVLAGLLAVGLHQVHQNHRELVAWQSQLTATHDIFRVANSLLSADLREAVPANGDLLLPEADSLIVRAPVGLAFVCATRTNPALIALDHVQGRPPDSVGDSILLYARSGWGATRVEGVDRPGQRGMECALGATTPEAQIRLPSGRADDVPVGAPVRMFRRHTYHVVRNSNESWLARTTADGTEPLVGPLGPGGIRFSILDGNGTETTELDAATGLEFRMILWTSTTPDTVTTLLQVNTR